jgi:hypothetical protein
MKKELLLREYEITGETRKGKKKKTRRREERNRKREIIRKKRVTSTHQSCHMITKGYARIQLSGQGHHQPSSGRR